MELSLAEKQQNIDAKGSEGLRKQATQIIRGKVSKYKGPGWRSAWSCKGTVWLEQSVHTGDKVRGVVEADGTESYRLRSRLRFHSE